MAANEWNVLLRASIPSDALAGREVMEDLLSHLEAIDWIQEEVFGIHLAVEEALVNAIRHGNGEDTSKQVNFCCKLARDCLLIEIEDEGSGFDPSDVPDPTEEDNLEVPSGRGIMLMGSFMSRVEYNDRGNRVTMEKTRVVNGTSRDGDV